MLQSIFTRPVFINPQAYLVIPELALLHKCVPYDFSSNEYIFQIITTGQIEGKLIQAGDEYILHLDLYSNEGNVVLGEFYLDGDSVGDAGDFTLQQANGFVTLVFGEGGGSGNISYPGLIAAWSAKGKSNDDEDRTTLRDLTGNGHDITLNGFAFSEMSGYGGYVFNMNSVYISSWATESTEKSYNKVICKKRPKQNMSYLFNVLTKGVLNKSDISFTTKSFKLKITGLDENEFIQLGYLANSEKDGQRLWELFDSIFTNLGNGEHIIPSKQITVNLASAEEPITTVQFPRVFTSKEDGSECRIEFELLPEYPDALVFDGVDDYGINENMPILTDYTIIAKRKLLGENITWAISKRINDTRGAFNFEYRNNNTEAVRSFGNNNILNLMQDDVSWQTKNTYNQNIIIPGTYEDTTSILIGSGLKNVAGVHEYSNIAFYSAYLFDRSLDEQEIKSFIRKYIDPEYLLPSEIPTPDCYYDFSQGSNDNETIDTIKDYSGNGNDAVAHNFAWSGMSGYGGFVLDDSDFLLYTSKPVTVSNHIITLNKCNYDEPLTYNYTKYIDKNAQRVVINRPAFKIKVSGIGEYEYIYIYGSLFDGNKWSQHNKIDNIGNGIIDIPAINQTYNQAGTESKNLVYQDFIIVLRNTDSNKISSESIITIEILPEYEGALVFDGVDDKIQLSHIQEKYNTIFIKYRFIPNSVSVWKYVYDFRLPNDTRLYYAIVGEDNHISCNGTKKILDNYLHIIDYNKQITDKGGSILSFIGCNSTNDRGIEFCSMALYKFLGFKEALTEEQINAIIKKYNLLDGVDEIEVS